ncbi:unnamed protein product, partial [Symbiodinium microadriaticum]
IPGRFGCDRSYSAAYSQPLPADRPGSSKDDIQISRGPSPSPTFFDVDLLDRRAQPLYAHPHYKPIECMVFDKRPWICFYGGSTPTVVAETDGYWYTMYDREGGCCLPGWPMFLLQDFMRLFADPPPSPEPTQQTDDAASSPRDFVRDRFPLPANYRSAFGRFWHLGCAGTHSPRSLDPPSRPPTVQIARDMQPRDIPGRKGSIAYRRQSPKTSLQPSLPSPASDAYRGTAYHHKGEKDVCGETPTPTYPAVTSEYNHQTVQPATDTSVVGELHQEAQNALGPAAGVSASPSGELQTQNATAAEQRRLAAKLLRTATEDLPSRQSAPAESKHRTAAKPPAQQARQVGLVSRASQETSRKEACLSVWHELLQILGSASSFYSSLANSKYPEALLKKSLEKFTAGTLERYIAAAKHFLDFLGLSNRTIASIDVAFLADFLHACENSLEEDREVCKIGPRPILKALSWLGRHAEVPALQPLLQASLIRAFLTQPSTDRKEALPLPMAVVVEWERYICSPHCPQDLRLFLGGLLLALHGGLRFGDLQRIRLNSLSLTSHSLRGVCWQTKTTKRGQPFAVTLHGISGRAVDSLWVLPFLRAVQSAWIATESAMGLSVVPDFILPVLTNLGGLARPNSTYLQPMAYSQSLAAMRHFLTIPWQDSTKPIPVTPEESRGFTLRSLKVCLLAAGAQVRATEEARQHQGHHKSPSVQLYSRDDTILALDLQKQIPRVCSGVASGLAYSQGRSAPYTGASLPG